MTDQVSRQILWSATLGPASLRERIEAAAANGYHGITVRPHDIGELRRDARDVARVCADGRERGVEHLVLEALSAWYDHEPAPDWFPSAAETIEDHLRAAEAFGCTDLNVVAPLRTASETTESLTERFAVVCDRCAEAGLAVHLEFTPFPPIGSLATAWEIVRGAARTNGGILFDTWHFFRGVPDLDLLAGVPGERIFSVQVSDGAPELRESLVKDTFRHRLLPGEGTFDLLGVLRVLRRTGGLNLVGPEVLSTELDALSAIEAARLAGEALDHVMADI
jgi:sugar phosphate isomerase/epimerase